jgi:hypothetical protein
MIEMIKILKNLYLELFRQLRARKNLYHIHDSRAFWPRIHSTLLDAAELWPEVLPLCPTTILDIGAHNGKVAEQLSELYRPLFIGMVEPLPQFASVLKTKLLAPRQSVFNAPLRVQKEQDISTSSQTFLVVRS